MDPESHSGSLLFLEVCILVLMNVYKLTNNQLPSISGGWDLVALKEIYLTADSLKYTSVCGGGSWVSMKTWNCY